MLVRDASRLAQVFASSIEEHPLLVYTAALHFAPANTALYKAFHNAHSYSSVTRSFGHPWSTLLLVLVRCGWSGTTIVSAVFSADGSRLVSGSFNNIVQVWDATSGVEILPALRGHTGWVHSVDISPDGTRIVSGSQDMTIRVWDATSHLQLQILRGHQHGVQSVAFSPDGTRVVSGSRDATICIWDATLCSEPLQTYQGHHNGVWSVTFSYDRSRIVASSDNTI